MYRCLDNTRVLRAKSLTACLIYRDGHFLQLYNNKSTKEYVQTSEQEKTQNKAAEKKDGDSIKRFVELNFLSSHPRTAGRV